MKKYCVLLLLVLMMGGAKAQSELSVTDFDWLAGNWVMDAGKMKIYESWTKSENNTYQGIGYVVKGKDTIVTELIKIEKIGLHWAYIAQVNKNNPVLFTLTPTSTAKYLVFENLEHGNPQRVIYKWMADNEVFARTEGIENGKQVADDYYYKSR